MREFALMAAMLATTTTAAAADIPGNTSTRVAIEVGTTYFANAEVLGDSDWFRVQLTAGRTYSLVANDPYGAVASDFQFVRMHDAAGRLLSRALEFTASGTGLHFWAVAKVYDEDPHFGGSYSFGIRPDCAGTVRTTCKATVGRMVEGKWDHWGDVDYRAISLVAGRSYLFWTEYGHEHSGNLRLRDRSGRLLAGLPVAPNGGTGVSFTYRPTISATYFVAAAQSDLNSETSSGYAFTVAAEPR